MKKTVVPFSTALSAQARPPCRWTILFARANRSVPISSFAVLLGKEVFEQLAKRLEELPGLRVVLFLNVPFPGGSGFEPDAVARDYYREFLEKSWPSAQAPELCSDPRSLALGAGGIGLVGSGRIEGGPARIGGPARRMLDHEATRAISLVGLGIQTALTLLLALLFAVLSRTGSERRYFSIWTRAWGCLFVGLVSLCLFFTSTSTPAAQQAFAFVYQAGKAAYFLGLAGGAWVFVMGPSRRPFHWPTTVPFAVMMAASLPFLANVEKLIAVQAILAVPVLTWAARQMAFTRAPRRTAAVTACGGTLGAMATLWALYLLEYASRTAGFPAPRLIQDLVAGYNSYLDLLLETLLAFGMVLVRSEDAQRELVAAHEALGEAHARLRESSLRDPLTAALNRRAFDEHTETLPSGGGTVVALDLDGLKSVNDRWGHEAGDELLRHFASSMRAQLRDSDRLYRTGGDEFVIIALGADPERLSSRIDRALAGIAPLAASATHPGVPVAASWGAAAFNAPAEVAEALRTADARMYERKHGGRRPAETDVAEAKR